MFIFENQKLYVDNIFIEFWIFLWLIKIFICNFDSK